jgi:hypothetical protein
MPVERVGAPLPLRIVLGIDVALLPAALADVGARAETEIAIAHGMDSRRNFMGDLQGWLVFPV